VSSRGATAALYPRPMPDHITIGAGLSMGGSEPVISDAVRSGDLLFLSGRAAVDPVTLEVVSDSFDEQAAFVLGGSVLTAPTVQLAITDPTTQISGNQTEATAKDLADRLEVARLGMRYEVEAVEVTR